MRAPSRKSGCTRGRERFGLPAAHDEHGKEKRSKPAAAKEERKEPTITFYRAIPASFEPMRADRRRSA